jgi:hypothetical protein
MSFNHNLIELLLYFYDSLNNYSFAFLCCNLNVDPIISYHDLFESLIFSNETRK